MYESAAGTDVRIHLASFLSIMTPQFPFTQLVNAVANAPLPGSNGSPRGSWSFTVLAPASLNLLTSALTTDLTVLLMSGDATVLDMATIDRTQCVPANGVCKVGSTGSEGTLRFRNDPKGFTKVMGSFKKCSLVDAGAAPLRVLIITDTVYATEAGSNCRVTKTRAKPTINSGKSVKAKANTKTDMAARNSKQRCT